MARLEEINALVAARGGGTARIGDDPALDQFMEAYCEMLTKYEQELCKTFTEAVLSLSRIESQFQAISSSDSGKYIYLFSDIQLFFIFVLLYKFLLKFIFK